METGDSFIISERIAGYKIPYFSEEELDYVPDVEIDEIYVSRKTPILNSVREDSIKIEIVYVERNTPRY